MPRKACVTADEIFEAVKDKDCFKDNGHLKPRSEPVWAYICRSLRNKIQIINLYLYLKQNRNDVLHRIMDHKGIAIAQDEEHLLSSDSCDTSMNYAKENESTESNCSDSKTVHVKNGIECPALLYTLTIDAETWQRIGPKTVMYKEHDKYRSRRKYSILQRGWTDVISELCWSETKVPCVYTFKRAKIYNSINSTYVTIFGRCKDCHASFSAHATEKPKAGSDLKLYIKTVDTRGIPHERKRALKGTKRTAVQKDLLHKKAIIWRREATSEMEYGDPEPSHLYSTDVLRKARQEGKDKDLGVHKIKDAIESIQNLKYDVQYAGAIREIGLDKFYCMYWSPLQIDIYKDIYKLNNSISIDATGSLVQKIDQKNRKSGAIFLYQAVAPGITGIVPLFQMLSEKHDANMIQYWISEWLRCGGKIPHEIVTDFSFALLNAVARAFNNCSLAQYITNCLKYLNHEQVMPICHMRLDIAHVIKMIAKWQCFRRKAPRVKDFYLRCVGFLTTVESKNQFEDIFYSILIVALSECDDKNSECMYKQEFLLQTIRNFMIDEKNNPNENDNFNDNDPDEIHEMENEHLCNLNQLLASAKDVAEKTQTGERPNPYYCPDFVTPFLRFASYYVLWTNVMVQKPKSKCSVASSARSEAYFNDVKNITFSDEGKPIRADKFIIKHVRSVNSICKIERAALDNRATKQNSVEKSQLNHDNGINREADSRNHEPSYIVEESYLNSEENWRGLNPSKRLKQKDQKEGTIETVKKRGKYLTACPDITFIHNRPLRRKKGICIQNGSLLPPIKIGTRKLQAVSTCPFDALTELLATAYADSVIYKNIVDEKFKDMVYFEIIRNYAINGVSNRFYFKRLSYLATLFDTEKCIIDCACNISTFITKVLLEAPSVSENNACTQCHRKEEKNLPIIDINTTPVLEYGLHNGLQKSLDMFFAKDTICRNCNGKVFREVNPHTHIFIDIECAYHSALLNTMGFPNSPKHIPLSDIPVHVNIKNEKYQLIGAITYSGTEQSITPGHYIAYCYRVNQEGSWEEYDDLRPKHTSLQKSTAMYKNIKPHIVVYMKLL